MSETHAQDELMSSALGRFGHHPDPAIDFCIEVEELEGMAYNRRVRFDPEPDLDARIERALDFRVGGDPGAVAAKGILRALRAALQADPEYLSEITPQMRQAAHREAVKLNPGRSEDHIGSVVLDALSIHRAMVAAAPPPNISPGKRR